jgi:hypothetical protein
MDQREIYDGWYKLDEEVVYVWPASQSQPRTTVLPEVGPAGMMKGVYAPRNHREYRHQGFT